MSRPKGLPKTGGRKKGFPYYKNGLPVEQLLDDLKHNPIANLARMADDEENPVQIRAWCEDKLAKYVKPQLSTIACTVAGDPDNPLKIQSQLTVEVTRREPIASLKEQ